MVYKASINMQALNFSDNCNWEVPVYMFVIRITIPGTKSTTSLFSLKNKRKDSMQKIVVPELVNRHR